jgi:3'-5' exoribonuclease
MRTIKSLSDVSYSQQETIQFEATVIDIIYEGLEESKRPMRLSLKLEETGEMVQVISWTYALLNMMKDALKSIEVVSFEALAGMFSNKQEQIRVGNAQFVGKKSTRKIIKTVDILGVKRDLNSIINKYLTTPLIRDMVETLVMKDQRFFEWPAATKIHHAYEGGLAVHTLQVTKNAISIWENYQGQNLDLEVVVAGAMLHDIGKLSEYNKDGSRTIYGNLVSHLVEGSEKISEFCFQKGIVPSQNIRITIIKHIVLSHHERLEFNAAVTPATVEAIVVARADALDGSFEGISKELENLPNGEFTDKLMAANGTKILKWK